VGWEALRVSVGQPALDELCEGLVKRITEGDAAGGLVETIHAAGERLATALPREAGDVNELADALVLMD